MFLKKLCALLRIDEVQFRALLRIHLLLDFRSSRIGGSSSRKQSFVLNLIFYVIIGLFVGLSGLRLFDLFGFAFLTLTVSMVLTAMAIIIEFNEIIINPEDAEILGHRPIDTRTYFWVKMANLLFYVTSFGLAINLSPAFIGLAFPEASGLFPLLYLIVSWLANVATAFGMILLYSVLVRWLNYERLKDILAYVQVVFTFIVFVGYQFLMRLIPEMHKTQLNGVWYFFVPSAWYAEALILPFDSQMLRLWFLAALALISFVGLAYFASRNLSLGYAELIYKLSQSARIRETGREEASKSFRGFSLRRWLLRNPVERVGYELVSRYIRRNRNMRMRVFPAFAMPLAVMGMFILDGELTDPFIAPNTATLMSMFFLIYIAVIFNQIITTSDHWQASWIFRAAPVPDYSRLYWGGLKVLLVKYMLPYFVLIWGVLSSQMSVRHAFYLAVLNYAIYLAYSAGLAVFVKDLPLSKKFERGRTNLGFLVTFVLFPLLLIIGGVEYLICRFPAFLIPGVVTFLLLAWILSKISSTAINRRIQQQEFLA